MNKQVKSFFKNYEQNMKPDVDLGLLRSKVASLKNLNLNIVFHFL